MDFELTLEEREFEEEVHGFFESQDITEKAREEFESGISTGPFTRELWKRLGEKGWICPHWPKKYGGLELSLVHRYILEEAHSYFGTHSNVVASGMAGPVILRNGTDEQRDEFLLRIAKGEIEFALGYTEPQAGSDLSAIDIRADEADDHFILNGQKLFNTGCHYSDYHWLLVRTEKAKPRYKGLSFLIVDLNSPGITVKPIWVMGGTKGGSHRTNEVYYDNVKVPKERMVGQKNKGFYMLMEALSYERNFPAAQLQRHLAEFVDWLKESGKSKDPIIRQRVAELRIDVEFINLMAMRIAWILQRGDAPDVEAALAKTKWYQFMEDLANLGVDVLGPFGLLHRDSRWATWSGQPEWLFRDFLFFRVAAGTPEIMWNIVAQRGLGLPR
ncbi:acyl-CoA dehydrogenase family protein [Chloroflexota bacterium]